MGLGPEQFWRLTIRALYWEFAAHQLRSEDEANRDITLAWNGVRIYVKTMNGKKLPTLKTFLVGERGRSRPLTMAEQRANMEMLSAQMGIPLRRSKPKETADGE